MIEILRYFGLPVGISSVSGRIDEIIVIVHYLMLVLFVGWGIFFIVSLVKFRSSKNKKANYIHFKIKGNGKIIKELEKNESIDQNLLRYLTVKVKKFDLEANYFSKNDEKEKKNNKN